jgi:hypothetical protein
LVINQAQLDRIDLAKKAFPYKRIEEQKQESINMQSEIADAYEKDPSKRFKLLIQKQ